MVKTAAYHRRLYTLFTVYYIWIIIFLPFISILPAPPPVLAQETSPPEGTLSALTPDTLPPELPLIDIQTIFQSTDSAQPHSPEVIPEASKSASPEGVPEEAKIPEIVAPLPTASIPPTTIVNERAPIPSDSVYNAEPKVKVLVKSLFEEKRSDSIQLTKKSYMIGEAAEIDPGKASINIVKSIKLKDRTGKAINTVHSKNKKDGVDTLRFVPEGQLRPGVYTATIEDSAGNVVEESFAWGVLAINTNKAEYKVGETAVIQMAALTDFGHTVCDADLLVEVADPTGKVDSFSTKDGTITMSDECHGDNVTDIPDYVINFETSRDGNYEIKLSNLENGYFVTDTFSVHDTLPYSIERIGATRINPFQSDYSMTLRITASSDFEGTITDEIPKDFTLTDGQTSWYTTLSAGSTKTFMYRYRAPEISPLLYTIGPATLKSRSELVYTEGNTWQIAADASCISAGTGNWTAITWTNCASGPQSGDTVTISGGNTVTLNASPTIAGLTFAGTTTAAVLTHSGSNSLTINGNVTMNRPTNTRTNNWQINAGSASVTGSLTYASDANTSATRIQQITITSGSLSIDTNLVFNNSTGNPIGTKVLDLSGGAGSLTVKGTVTGCDTLAGTRLGATLTAGSTSSFVYAGNSATARNVCIFAGGDYNHLAVQPTSGSPTYTVGTASSQTLDVNNLTIGTGSAVVTVTAATHNPTINITGSLTLSDSSTYTKGSGATTLMPAGTKTWTDSNSVKQCLGAVTIGSGSSTPHIDLGSSVKVDTLTIAASHTLDLQSGGYTLELDNAGATSTVLSVSGTLTTGTNSTVKYAATNSGGNVNVVNIPYDSLQLSGTETYVLTGNQTGASALTGSLTIDNGAILDVVNGSNFGIALAENWSNSGTFTARNGTVTFAGSDGSTQVLTGSTSFYDFTASTSVNSSGRTLRFTAGTTQTITGTWTVTGFSGKVITLESSTTSAWTVNPTAAAVDYASVSYSTNTGTGFCATHSTNGGNNTSWSITSGTSCASNTSPNNPSDLSQKKTTDTILVVGAFTEETSVQFTATASDPDASDTLQLCIEKDTVDTAFSNTEDSCGTGAAYSGSPLTLTNTVSSITDAATYHWQARIKDAAGAYSSWISFGSNSDTTPGADRDFGIDSNGAMVISSAATGTAHPGHRHVIRTDMGGNGKRTFVTVNDGANQILYYTDNPDTTYPVWSITTFKSGSTYRIHDMVWDETNDVIYLCYARGSLANDNNADVLYRRISSLGTTPTLGAEQTVLDGTAGGTTYSNCHIELAGDSSTNKVVIFSNEGTAGASPSGAVVRSGTLNSDTPTWDTVYTVRSWTSATSSGIFALSRVNTNKLAIMYYNGTDIMASRHDDSSAIGSSSGWDALDGTDNSETTVSSDDPVLTQIITGGSMVGGWTTDIIWLGWVDSNNDINTRRWSGSALDTEMTPVALTSSTIGPAFTNTAGTVFMAYRSANDETQLVYQSRLMSDGSSSWSGSETLIVDVGTEHIAYPNVPKRVSQSKLDAVTTTTTSYPVRYKNVTVSMNTAPGVATSLVQKTTSDVTIGVGHWHNNGSIKFVATVDDPDSSDTLQLCVEKDTLSTSFGTVEDSCGTGVAYSGTPVTASVTIGSHSEDQYHWRARVKDAAGEYSSWVSYSVNAESARDYGIDTTAPTGGVVYDGTNPDVDAAFNTGSLSSLSAVWGQFNFGISDIVEGDAYEYSIGSTPGAIDIKTWTGNGMNVSVTTASLTLQTNQMYYFNVRAHDAAGNTSDVVSSNGQLVAPSLSFTVAPSTLTFANLKSSNSYTDSQVTTLTTSTNAYNGYVVKAFVTDYLRSADSVTTIGDFTGGTYTSPAAWESSTGLGYTSSDTTIQGSNKFGTGSLFAPFSHTAPGDIVADHTSIVSGSAVNNEQFTITNKVTASAIQAAKTYSTTVVYTATAQY